MENGGGGGGGGGDQNQSINGGRGGHNGNNWDFWELGSTNNSSSSSSSRFDWSHHNHHHHHHHHQAAQAMMISNQQVNNAHPSSSSHHQYQQYLQQQQQQQQQQSSVYGAGAGGGGGVVHPDPHLTCLKLGKRHYFEDHGPPPPPPLQQQQPPPPPQLLMMGERHVANGFPTMMIKRGRSFDDPGLLLIGNGGGQHSVSPSSTTTPSISSTSSVGSTVVIPRCQVEGCHVALIHAKDYHRRHKVCEMHSKAPKVVVLGIEQRFCQQCSRFHVVSEFDDSKRSCRRRLAGHNERRRKSTSSNESNISRNPNQEPRSMDNGRFSYISPSTGRALSLLSSSKLSTSWVSPADLSTRSSAALRELIAEKRAAVLGKQLLFEQNWHQNGIENTGGGDHQTHGGNLSQVPGLQHQVFPADPSEWDRFQESDAHVTLDLMQTPSSPFGFLSAGRSNNKSNKDEEEDQCCEIWKSLEGTHVV